MPIRFCPKCGHFGCFNDWVIYCSYCGTELIEKDLSREEFKKCLGNTEESYKNIEALIYPEKLDPEAVKNRIDIEYHGKPNPLPDPNEQFRPKKSWLDKFFDWHDKYSQPQSVTVVKCPYCGSTNTKKIGAGGRAVSTATLGLASGKIGKQWHCKKCGSDF